MTVEEALSHAGPMDLSRIEARALDALPHYIWMWGSGKGKSGVCSGCHHVHESREELERHSWIWNDPYIDFIEMDEFSHPDWYKNDGDAECIAHHGVTGYCSHCGRLITYRDMHRGHSAMRDSLFLIDYRKSAIDENGLVMVGYAVDADWGKDLHENMAPSEFSPELTITPKEICIFLYGRGACRFVRDHQWIAEWDSDSGRARNFTKADLGWVQRTQVNSNYSPYGAFSHAPFCRHREDTADAIWDTPFDRVLQALDYQQNCDGISMIDWMAKIARYPSLEYLVKLGMGRLALNVVNGGKVKHLNLRGKTAAQVLKIGPECWGWLKGNGKVPDEAFLSAMQFLTKKKIRMGFSFVWNLSRRYPAGYICDIVDYSMDAGQAGKMIRYMAKKNLPARDYADHLRMMKALHMDMRDEAMLYPQDFHTVHGRIAMRMKIQTDAAQQGKLEKFLESLSGYRFSAMGLVLSPIDTLENVIREGNALSHCVGSYCNRYAGGGIILCTLREEMSMDIPLYTVEFALDGRMVQCRGYKNTIRPADEDRLSQFWRLFDMMRRDAAAGNRPKGKGRAA